MEVWDSVVESSVVLPDVPVEALGLVVSVETPDGEEPPASEDAAVPDVDVDPSVVGPSDSCGEDVPQPTHTTIIHHDRLALPFTWSNLSASRSLSSSVSRSATLRVGGCEPRVVVPRVR